MDQVLKHQTEKIFSPVSVYEKVKRLVDFERGPKLKILDVGSGAGVMDSELREMGHEVVELDTHPQAYNSRLIVCDIEKTWPVGDKSFDLVVCTDVPEHLYDPLHVLAEATRVLKDSGKIIFGVPNHFDVRQRLRMLFGKGVVHWDQAARFGEKAWNYSHIRFLTLPELQEMFAVNGWQVYIEQFNFMSGGLVPGRLLPSLVKKWLVQHWPGLFSGKFIFLLGREKTHKKTICIPYTPRGM